MITPPKYCHCTLMATVIGSEFSFNWIIDELEKKRNRNRKFAMGLCIHFGSSLMWVDWQCRESHRVDSSCFFLLKSLNMKSLEVLREPWSYMSFVCFERWLMKWKIELTVCWTVCWIMLALGDWRNGQIVWGCFFLHTEQYCFKSKLVKIQLHQSGSKLVRLIFHLVSFWTDLI